MTKRGNYEAGSAPRVLWLKPNSNTPDASTDRDMLPWEGGEGIVKSPRRITR